MKTSVFVLSILILCGMSVLTPPLFAQQEYYSWDLSFSKFSEPIDCIRVSDTSFIMLARSGQVWPFNSDSKPIVACYTISGQLLWQAQIEIGTIYPSSILPTPDGWKVIGMGRSGPKPSDSLIASRLYLDNVGHIIRKEAYPAGEVPYISHVIPLDNGRYAITTATDGNPRVNVYSSDDKIRWYQSFNVENPTLIYGISKAGDGLIVSGRAIPVDTNYKAYTLLARLSSSGEIEWSRTLKPPTHEYNIGVVSLSDGTFLSYGFQQVSLSTYLSSLVVTRISADGDSIESINDTRSRAPVPTDMIQRGGGEILVSWVDLDSGYVGHVSFYEAGQIDEIALSGLISPIKMLHMDENTMLVFDTRSVLTADQTSLEELFTRVIVLTRQNTSEVHMMSEFLPLLKMNLY